MLMMGVAVIMQTTPTILFAAVDWNSIVHARDVVVPPLRYSYLLLIVYEGLAITAQCMMALHQLPLWCDITTVEPLYSGHPWGTTFWPLYRGGLYSLRGVPLYMYCNYCTVHDGLTLAATATCDITTCISSIMIIIMIVYTLCLFTGGMFTLELISQLPCSYWYVHNQVVSHQLFSLRS